MFYKLFQSIITHQNAGSGQNPFVRVTVFILHVEIGSEYVGRSSHTGDVDRTTVLTDDFLIFNRYSLNEDDWQPRMDFLDFLVNQVTLLTLTSQFPSGSFQIQSMNIGSLFGRILDIFMSTYLCDSGLKGHVVKRETI